MKFLQSSCYGYPLPNPLCSPPARSCSSSPDLASTRSFASTPSIITRALATEAWIPPFRELDIRCRWNGRPEDPLDVDIMYQLYAEPHTYQILFEHSNSCVRDSQIVSVSGFDLSGSVVARFYDYEGSDSCRNPDSAVDLSLPPSPTPSSHDELPWFSSSPVSTDASEEQKLIGKDVELDYDNVVMCNRTDKIHRLKIHIRAKILLQLHAFRGYIFTIPGLPVLHNDPTSEGFLALKIDDGNIDTPFSAWREWSYLTPDFQPQAMTSLEQYLSFSPSLPFSLRLLRPQDLPILDVTDQIEDEAENVAEEKNKTAECRCNSGFAESESKHFPPSEENDNLEKIYSYNQINTPDEHKNNSSPLQHSSFSSSIQTVDIPPITGLNPQTSRLRSHNVLGIPTILNWIKVLILSWLFLRAFFHQSTIQFENNVRDELLEWTTPIRQLTVETGNPNPPTLSQISWPAMEEEANSEPEYDGPITVRDYIDYYLGWRGPNGTWR